jgi:hypothetical protein
MKRKHFTKPPNLTTFGNWVYCEIFTRNITINEMAAQLDVSAPTFKNWMDGSRPIHGHRILEICAILAADMMDYNLLVINAMRALPSYRQTFYKQKGLENAKH